MDLPTLRIQGNLLFVTLRVNSNNNKNLHSPPEGVVTVDVNDCQNGVTLLSFYQVWHFTGTSPFVNSSHNSKWLYELRKTEIFAGLCNSNVEEKIGCTSQNVQDSGISQHVVFSSKTRGKKWRLVIDQNVLNKHLLVLTFKMETAEVVRNTICKGLWVVSIDLTDVYFYIPIHEKSQHLLRFHVAGQTYQFWAFPFGIATARLKFTQVVKEVKFMLQNRGIQVHRYLDDWLLRAPSEEICLNSQNRNQS